MDARGDLGQLQPLADAVRVILTKEWCPPDKIDEPQAGAMIDQYVADLAYQIATKPDLRQVYYRLLYIDRDLFLGTVHSEAELMAIADLLIELSTPGWAKAILAEFAL